MADIIGNNGGTFNDRVREIEGTDAAEPRHWNDPHFTFLTNNVLLKAEVADVEARVVTLEQGGGAAGNGSIDDNAIGNRSINPGLAPTGNGPASLTQWLSYFANRIKAITGGANWFDNPTATLNDLDTRLSALEGAGGSGVAYDVSGFYPGVPTANAIVLAFVTTRNFTLSAGTGGRARSTAAAAGNTTFSIQKNGSSIGDVTFTSGASTGTVSVPSSQTLAPGDVLTVVAPGTADANIANISVTLVGGL